MPFVMNLFEFEQKQKCNRITVNGRMLFENGAVATSLEMMNPPKNKWAKLANQRAYYEAVIKKEKKEFTEYKQSLVDQAKLAVRYGNVMTPDEDDLLPLEAGKKRIARLNAKLQKIVEELEKSPQAESRRQRERESIERSQEATEFVNKLMAISYDDDLDDESDDDEESEDDASEPDDEEESDDDDDDEADDDEDGE